MSEHREQCKRQHRLFGLFLAIQTWREGIDGIEVDRRFLESFFGLSRFKGVRITWLLQDIKPWFSFSVQRHYSPGPVAIASLVLSRVPISWDKIRVENIRDILARQDLGRRVPKGQGSSTEYQGPTRRRLMYPDEKWVTEYLLQLAAGLREP